MKMSEPHVSIIMLNWNGWNDTLDCLESILKMDYRHFSLILIDNHSTDNSVQEIRRWAKLRLRKDLKKINDPSHKNDFVFLEIEHDNIYSEMSSEMINNSIVFIKNPENKGFAKATNQGLHLAQILFASEYYYLLNNDTVVDEKTLTELVNVLENNPEIGLAQSIIYNYGTKDKINNAGGRIFFWGQTKYYKSDFAGELKTISFINGCALFARAGIFRDYGYLSEKFFFGEEDFELSMRMKCNHIKMVCCTTSYVYHKVAITSQKYFGSDRKKAILHIMNRLVDMKSFYPSVVWRFWKMFVLSYFSILLLIRYRSGLVETTQMYFRMNNCANRLNDVTKDTIEIISKEFGL